MASKKAGHPHPDSYLHSDEKSSSPQTKQQYIPLSLSRKYSPEKGLIKTITKILVTFC